MEWNVFNARRERRPARAEAPGQHEDNLSRALLIVWRALASQGCLGQALRGLGQGELFARLVDIIQAASGEVLIGAQGLPELSDQELLDTPRMLVGISSSRSTGDWTHDQRRWPEHPRPDGWIHVPGKALLVFEAKTADHALDATQVLAYCSRLRLVDECDGYPFPEPGDSLSADAAARYQTLLQPWVLDATWTGALQGLRGCSDLVEGQIAKFLLSQCADYLEDNRFVPWGPGCFGDLGRLDTPRRVENGRLLMGRYGHEIERQEQDLELVPPVVPVLTKPDMPPQHWRAPLGASGFPYLGWKGPELDSGLGSSAFFCLNLGEVLNPGEDSRSLFTIEIYVEARGANTGLPSRASVSDDTIDPKMSGIWKRSRERHAAHRARWEEALLALPASLEVTIGAVKYKGINVLWRGSERDGTLPSVVTTVGDLARGGSEWLDRYWSFPQETPGATLGDYRKMASQVRKPAISLFLELRGSEAPTVAELRAAFAKLAAQLS